MTEGSGDCRIDGVDVGRLEVQLLGLPAPVMSVTYALVNTKSGDKFGSGNRNTLWSDETYERLRALLESIEADVCGSVFEGGATAGGGVLATVDATDSVPSL